MDILAFNQPYLSQPGFREVFAAAGHRCLSIGWYDEGCDVVTSKPVLTFEEVRELLPPGFNPERIIYFDHSEPLRVLGLDTLTIPTIVHLVDTHIHKSWHPVLSGCFDVALLAMRGYNQLFVQGDHIPPVYWLPLWAFRLGADPKYDRPVNVSFRGTFGGTHPKRPEFFGAVNKKIPGDYGQGPFFDLYNSSKIILNDCINDDLNWRVFEALASGAMLLTPRVSQETLDLFPEGECLVTYRPHDVDDAVSKLDYYLKNSSERLAIATAGYERVMQGHMGTHRGEMLLRILESAKPRPRAEKIFCAAATYLRLAVLFPGFQRATYLNAAQAAVNKMISCPELTVESLMQKQQVLKVLMESVRG
jgi:hypothetical protein